LSADQAQLSASPAGLNQAAPGQVRGRMLIET
jgi:hypothetical protein